MAPAWEGSTGKAAGGAGASGIEKADEQELGPADAKLLAASGASGGGMGIVAPPAICCGDNGGGGGGILRRDSDHGEAGAAPPLEPAAAAALIARDGDDGNESPTETGRSSNGLVGGAGARNCIVHVCAPLSSTPVQMETSLASGGISKSESQPPSMPGLSIDECACESACRR